MDNGYFKSPPVLVLNLMKKTFGSQFTYFLGVPSEIAVDAYPCLVVYPVTNKNTITGAPTGYDNIAEQINIHVLVNLTDTIGTSDTVNTAMWQLYETIQGRDPSTGYYLANTVIGALRANLSLTDPDTGQTTTIDHDLDVNYDVTPNSNTTAILEGIISIVTRELIPIPNRY